MPADARREPPSEARHGHGRPPDGPPDEGSWAFARGFRSLIGWPLQNAAPALPPLTSSGQQAPSEYGPLLDGGVHRLSVPDPAHTRANGMGNVFCRRVIPRVSIVWPHDWGEAAMYRSLVEDY